jgi:hypothetical protein
MDEAAAPSRFITTEPENRCLAADSSKREHRGETCRAWAIIRFRYE